MDERQALMSAIIANPDEDTPRLAFADWLQEHGDKHEQARAEFIRVQCEAAKLDEKSAERKKLETQAKAIHKQHARFWLGEELWELTRRWGTGREFGRGLLQWWHSSAAEFLQKAIQKALNEALPRIGVNTLLLTDPTKRAAEVANSPALAGASGFCWLSCKIGDDGFRAFANSPHTSKLSSFVVTHPACTSAGLKAFAKSKSYPNLQRFGIRGGAREDRYGYDGVRVILESEQFPKLSALDMMDVLPTSTGRKAFFESESLSRLRVLWLGRATPLGDVLAAPHLTNLEELNVSYSAIDDAQARTLVDSPTFAKLRQVFFYSMNSRRPPLSEDATKRLRDRFGEELGLDYSSQCRR